MIITVEFIDNAFNQTHIYIFISGHLMVFILV